MKKKVLLVFKFLLSAALLYFIFKKIPFTDVKQTLVNASWPYLGLATLFFVASKIIAAQRLQDYWKSIQIRLSNIYHLKLYLLGMFYNLFLPGGIGGDAYKGYVIKQQYETPTKKIVGILVLDRLSGLLLLTVFAGILILLPVHESLDPFFWWVFLALPLGTALFYAGLKKWYPETLQIFWSTSLKSALVQLSQIISAFFILEALGVKDAYGLYLLVFLLSSIVAVLPLTIGGVGSREFTFLFGAQWFGLDYDKAIAMSLLFFIITALISFLGIGYHLKKPSLVKLD
ncbi:MAG: flippase-like domain-containing protein [Flavobacteriaceae bacterium]|nr:flippase-like domain-containing protein [Flavobacteriaceae bacterium]MCI5087748.1 flippase-like domain-containing protein [Flavobacteriaceae bacterium]